MKQIKILLITDEYSEKSVGGAGIYAWELSRAIAKNGTEIHVLAPDYYSHDENLKENLFVHYKKTIFKPLLRMPSFHFQVWKSCNYLIKKYQITSIHSNNYAGIWVNTKTPLITMIHHPAIMEMQQFSVIQKSLNLIDMLLEKIIVQKSSLVISGSHLTYNQLLFIYPKIKNKSIFLPNGVDFSVYKPVKRVENSIFTIFFPGGARAKRKGSEYLFPALEKLNKEINFKLIVTGSSREEGWQSAFKSLIRRYHLEENVELMGEVNYVEISDIYNKADLVVFPSTFEGYGLPVLESLAMSKPIIATKTGEAPYIIKNGVNGLLVDTFDSDSIFKALQYLVKDKTLMKNIKSNSRQSIIRKYSWGLVAQKIIQIHKNIL